MSQQAKPDAGSNLTDDQLVNLHECILSTDVCGRSCENRECENDALVMVSRPRHHTCIPVCGDCLPDHVKRYEMAPAEYSAGIVKRQIVASLNPAMEYVRSSETESYQSGGDDSVE